MLSAVAGIVAQSQILKPTTLLPPSHLVAHMMHRRLVFAALLSVPSASATDPSYSFDDYTSTLPLPNGPTTNGSTMIFLPAKLIWTIKQTPAPEVRSVWARASLPPPTPDLPAHVRVPTAASLPPPNPDLPAHVRVPAACPLRFSRRAAPPVGVDSQVIAPSTHPQPTGARRGDREVQ